MAQAFFGGIHPNDQKDLTNKKLGRHGKFTPIHHTPIYAPCKEIFCAFYDFYVDLTTKSRLRPFRRLPVW